MKQKMTYSISCYKFFNKLKAQIQWTGSFLLDVANVRQCIMLMMFTYTALVIQKYICKSGLIYVNALDSYTILNNIQL